MLEDEISLLQKIETLAERDNAYRCAAYLFVYAALEYTVKTLQREQETGQERHVSGQELSHGIASYAREQFGPMVRSVFDHWGIHSTLDFGKIVFRLIEEGVMRKTENDRLEDFRNVYDFDRIFDPKKIQNSIAGLDLDRL